MAIDLGRGRTAEGKNGSAASYQLCCTPSFRFSEKHPYGISVSQLYTLGATYERENSKKFEDFVPQKVGKLQP
jgi:hypothetical protein